MVRETGILPFSKFYKTETVTSTKERSSLSVYFFASRRCLLRRHDIAGFNNLHNGSWDTNQGLGLAKERSSLSGNIFYRQEIAGLLILI